VTAAPQAYFHQGYFPTSDGAPLWYEVRGEERDAPAVLCDGLGCDGFIWRYLWEPLTARRRVLHWNYRGHGRSGVPTDDTRIGMEYICDDLARLMDHARLDAAVIFGHSMGVQVALEFHRRHRARVKGLVLICGSYGTPLDTWHDHTLMRVAFPYLKRLVERSPDVARTLASTLLNTQLAVEFGIRAELNPELIKPNDFAPYMEHLAKMHPLYFVRTLDSLKDHSAWDHLPYVDVPSMVIGGEGDKFTPVWLSQRMAEHIPQCEYVFAPGGTHTAPLERTELVNAAIERFLRERIREPKPITALP
jgi:pimeloyl-ACP methyl ester carboxylesterase